MLFATRAASTTLLAIGGLHVAWGLGSSWPRIDRDRAGGLLRGCRATRLSRLGARVVTGVLATRGAFDMAGRTDLLAPGSSSDRFRTLDRRIYSPLCLTLAALSLPRPPHDSL
jgi:hypothetical protein